MQVAACFVLIVLLTAHAGTNKILVTTEDSVNVACGENVTLRCAINEDVVVRYYWTDGAKTLCNLTSATRAQIHCRYTGTRKELTLNIGQVTPSDSGTYLCIAQTSSGHGMNQTHLHVSDCSQAESSKSKQTPNHARTSGSGWISELVSLISILTLISDLGI